MQYCGRRPISFTYLVNLLYFIAIQTLLSYLQQMQVFPRNIADYVKEDSKQGHKFDLSILSQDLRIFIFCADIKPTSHKSFFLSYNDNLNINFRK